MKSLLILRHIRVENATAINGLTYGFPGITSFLGYTHALSRALSRDHSVSLGGCGVVCHNSHIQAYRPSKWADYVFTLTRNPLTKDSKTASFVEEGRMHMTVSLIIECNFILDELDFGVNSIEAARTKLVGYLTEKSLQQRLSGGTIVSIGAIEFLDIPESSDEKQTFHKKQKMRLLPGFALVDRTELLHQHHASLKETNPEAEMLDAWLDFVSIKYGVASQDHPDPENSPDDIHHEWVQLEKPAPGYLVPISVGFKGISKLYESGEVASSRDPTIPFRFVETAYGIGQWISPHRLENLSDIFWNYHTEEDWYLCKNNFQPINTNTIVRSEH